MLHYALVEIRNLCWSGKAEQAAALSDVFHNLPVIMYSSEISFPWLKKELESYQAKYRLPGREAIGADYVGMLEKVIREENLFPDRGE